MSKETRSGSIDVLRCVCMIFIILGHMYNETFLCNLAISDGILYYFVNAVGNASRLSINCFLLISSWFLVGKKPNTKRFISVWYMTLFFNAVITIILFIAKAVPFSPVYFIQSFMPIIGRPQWYMCEYLLLLLISPLLNYLIDSVGRDVMKSLLLLGGILIIVPASVIPFNYTAPLFSEFLWFLYVYLLISYIKKYEVKVNLSAASLIVIALLLYVFLVLLRIVGDSGILSGTVFETFIPRLAVYYIGHYEALPALICSFSLFFAFVKIHVNCPNILSVAAKSTGVIYIIHTVPVFWRYADYSIWENIFHISWWYNKGYVVVGIFVIVLSLFVTGIVLYCLWEKVIPYICNLKLTAIIDKVVGSIII